MNDDAELLRRYAEGGANDAFAELVRRHLNLVYSAALRQLNGDAQLAADAAQVVFTDLARKAGDVAGHRVLAGWLFTSTRYVTAKLVRAERRRQAREEEVQLMHDMEQGDAAQAVDWDRVRPVLDDVMSELSERDREAILLRFFEGRDYAAVGARLNLSDNTARMRVERALDKLRALLARRGVKSTTAALAVALADQAVTAAPIGLAAAIAGSAVAGGATGIVATTAGATATFMTMTKIQMGMTAAIAAAGATGYMMQANTAETLRDEIAQLRREGEAVAVLRSENERLANAATYAESLRVAQADIERLRNEAAALKQQLQGRTSAPPKAAATTPAAPVALNGPVYDLSRLTQTPKAKFQARPEYPPELRASGVGGDVVVDFVVDVQGNVQNAFALRSSRREFEAAAVEAVSQWKFAPGEISGAAVNTHMQIPIVFTMKTEVSHAPTFWF